MRTLGDGNCAFNAFALGIQEVISKGKLDPDKIPQLFFDKATKLYADEWQTKDNIIAWLKGEFKNEASLIRLQKRLAPILRQVSVEYLKVHFATSNLDETFKQAIRDYLQHGDTGENPDNVFRLLPFVKEKFKEIDCKKSEDITIDQFTKWWDQQGRDKYFNYMSESAKDASDISRWGSQIELDVLAQLFNITIDFKRNGLFSGLLGCPHGYLDPDDPERPVDLDFTQLVNRDILAKRYNFYVFNHYQQEEFDKRLKAIPQYNVLIAKLEQYTTRALSLDDWVGELPAKVQAEVKQRLKKHSALTGCYALNDGDCKSKLPGPPKIEEINKRIQSLSDNVIAYLIKHYVPDQHAIRIQLNAGHWSYSFRSDLPSVSTDNLSQLNTSLSTTIKENLTHPSSGIRPTLHGTIYQLILLMWVFKYNTDKGWNFKLGTEVDDAEKFDDVVLGIQQVDGRLQYHYIQAKHKQDQQKSIGSTDLLNMTEGNFSLLKYFASYRAIKKKDSFKDGEIGDLILFTNAGIKLDENKPAKLALNKLLRETDCPNEFINIDNTKAKQYKFSFDQAKDEKQRLVEILKRASILHQLASSMADVLVTDKKKFGFKVEIFKQYHLALAQEVIDIENKKIQDNFLRGGAKKPALDSLLMLLKYYLKIKLSDKFDEWWKVFENKPDISMVSNFGEKIDIKTDPRLIDAEKTARAFSENFNSNTFIFEKKTIQGITGKQLEELAGHIIVRREDSDPENKKDFGHYYFSESFIENKKLKGNLNGFRSKLFEKLEAKKVDWRECVIKIKNYQTCEDSQLNGFDQLPVEIPADEVSEAEIDEFFSHLILAINQPNEIQLFEFLKEEIGDTVNLINSDFLASQFQHDMLAWFKDKQGRFLNKEDAEELFGNAKKLLAKLILLGPVFEYAAQVKRSHIKFNKPFPIQTLLDNKKDVQCIKCKHGTWLTAIKIYSTLKKKRDYEKDDSFIILKLKTAVDLNDRLKEAFAKSDLLIIECNELMEEGVFSEFLTSIKSVIEQPSSSNKKIWFILPHTFNLQIIEKVFTYSLIEDSQSDFDSLTKESQEYFLGKLVDVQGKTYPLGDLCQQNDYTWLSDQVLQLLISGKPLVISLPIVPMKSFDRQCYIARQFQRSIKIDSKILIEEMPDIILLASTNEQFIKKYTTFKKKATKEGEKPKLIAMNQFMEQLDSLEEKKREKMAAESIKLYVQQDDCEKAFDQLIQYLFDKKKLGKTVARLFFKRNIHLLLEEEGTLAWKKTHAHLDNLKKYVNEDLESCDESEFSQLAHSVIAAEPGMGKSTVLSHLIEEGFLVSNNYKLFLRVDLSQWKVLIDQSSFVSNNDVLNFFTHIYQPSAFGVHYLAYLLTNEKKTQQVHIYIDGFDEIDSTQQASICQLLTLLKSLPFSITVATRRHKTTQLENTLSVIAHQLKQVESHEQITYLKNYWCGRLKLIKKDQVIDKNKIDTFAKYIVRSFSKDFMDQENTFMGIPLQLRLIAEGFEANLLNFYESEATKPKESVVFNRVRLYENIIHNKLDIYLKDKLNIRYHIQSGIESSIKSAILEAHYHIAFNILYPASDILSVLSRYNAFPDDELQAVGLLDYQVQEIQFVHRTFGEYLAAHKLFRLLSQLDSNSFEYKVVVRFIFYHIFLDRSAVVCLFLSDLIKQSDQPTLQSRWAAILDCCFDTTGEFKQNILACQLSKKNKRQSGIIVSYLNDMEATQDSIFSSDEKEYEQVEIDIDIDIDKLVNDEKNKIANYVKKEVNGYSDVANDLETFINFFLKYQKSLSLTQMNNMLDDLHSALLNHRNGGIVKTAVFKKLKDLSIAYINKAYFPTQNESLFDLAKLSKFKEINPEIDTPSQHADPLATKAAHAIFSRELTDIARLPILFKTAEFEFKEITRAKIIYFFLRFKNEKRTLDKNQLDALLAVYDKFKNDLFYQQLILMLPDNAEIVYHLRYQLAFIKDDLVLLKKLNKEFLHIKYKPEFNVEKKSWTPLTESKVYFLLHSTIIFDTKQIEFLLKHIQKFEDKFDYKEIITKINPQDINYVKDKAIECADYQLLLKLQHAFPKQCILLQKDIEKIFNKKSLTWLERTGIAIVLKFKVLNFYLCRVFHKPIFNTGVSGWERIYSNNILSGLLLTLLDEEPASEVNLFAFLDLIKAFVKFEIDNHMSVDFDGQQIKRLLQIFNDLLNRYYFDKETLIKIADYFKFFMFYFDFMVFKSESSLLILDKSGDFQYELRINHFNLVVRQISSVFFYKTLKEPRPLDLKEPRPLDLKESRPLEKCSTDVEELRKNSIEFEILKIKRKHFLFSPETMLPILSGDKAREYTQALSRQRWHDAMQITRKKEGLEIVYDKNKYSFFSPKNDEERQDSSKIRIKY